MSTQLVYLVWLIASVIGALLITASPACRHWRKKLLLIVLGVGLVSAGFLIVNIYQRTPFFDAVEAGDLTRVKELLASDPALVRSETFMGYTGLHLAVRSNNSNMVQFLIKAGANVNAEGDGETPLLLAAFYGRPQIAEILLKAGADVNAPGFKDLDPPLTDFCITD